MKTFCVGLHKTGTTSLHRYAMEAGLRSIHSTEWPHRPDLIAEFEFFCDGGSHFDGDREFDLHALHGACQESRFVLQTRDLRDWVISKCLHAGWRRETEVRPDDPAKLKHDEWRYKSMLNVGKYIEHRLDYHLRALEYFEDAHRGEFLVIDVTDSDRGSSTAARLAEFLGVANPCARLPHANRSRSTHGLSPGLLAAIDDTIRRNSDLVQLEASKISPWMGG